MRVEIRLHATLVQHRPGIHAGEPFSIDIPMGTDIQGLIEHLGIVHTDVHLVMINGRVTHERTASPSEGDRIGLFPPVGGG